MARRKTNAETKLTTARPLGLEMLGITSVGAMMTKLEMVIASTRLNCCMYGPRRKTFSSSVIL
jgi:hypothetical protein